MSQMKVWSGGAWVEPNSVKIWDGAQWVEDQMPKFWDGAQWVECMTYAVSNLYSFGGGTTNRVYELNVDTLIAINTFTIDFDPDGGGAMGTRVYATDDGANDLMELNPFNMAQINNVPAFTSYPTGIGGTETQLFHGDKGSDTLYELNPDTLASIQTKGADWIWGVGGSEDRLFVGRHGDSNYPYNRILEYSTVNLAYIAYMTAPSPRGDEISTVGGTNDRLYCIDSDGYDNDMYYEIGLADFPNGGVLNAVDAGRRVMKGIGGTIV